jgi:exosortase A-associated hydrolase 1
MTRCHISFECNGDTLIGSLDAAVATAGLLIVTGGNELRCGSYGSHAELAHKIAGAGFPVMRFDRRGVGDSSGTNAEFSQSLDDIAAAITAFRSAFPRMKYIAAYGNCDAASALMLARGSGCDALVLANPWTFEPEPDAQAESEHQPQMTPGAIRAHYFRRLTDPRALLRLLTGKVKLGQMAGSLVDAAKPALPPSSLAQAMAAGLAQFSGPATLLIAERDRTGQVFLSQWNAADQRLRICPKAGHSFVEPQARIWLQGQLLGALRSLG